MTSKVFSVFFFVVTFFMFCSSQRLSIINGKTVEIKEFPYQCALQYQGKFFCGASILSECFAITAAHCTNELNTYLSLRCGSKQYNASGTVVKVKTVHQHELYNPETYDFDYSILELQTCLTFDSTIKPIKLPKEGLSVKAGVKCKVSGFGYDESGSISPFLKATVVTVIDQVACMSDYKTHAVNFDITPQMLCAGVLKSAKPSENEDSCTGDSGGPLVCNGILEGSVSVGYDCGLAKYPGVYARITAARSWIKKITSL